MTGYFVMQNVANELLEYSQKAIASKVFDRMVGDLEFAGQVEELTAMAEEYEYAYGACND